MQQPRRTTVFDEDLIAPFASGASYSKHYFITSRKVCFPRFLVFRLKDCRCEMILAATQEERFSGETDCTFCFRTFLTSGRTICMYRNLPRENLGVLHLSGSQREVSYEALTSTLDSATDL